MGRRSEPREPVADPKATAARLVEEFRASGSEENRQGMARYAIAVDDAFGVSIPRIRELCKPFRRDHALAGELWATGVHEARLAAAFVDDPAQVTREQMEHWAEAFDSWDVTDQVTTSLFDLSPLAWDVAREWSSRPEEFVKRGGFALMAGLASHDKSAPDERFVGLLPLIEREAGDGRNFVKKAVNWALRNIGKRNAALNEHAVACAERILAATGASREPSARSARWVANDAHRELTSDKVRSRLARV